MYIKKLEVCSFGCLENKTIEFGDGFNLLYGDNESGKSTLFAFIVFMFYGTKIKKTPDSLSFKEKYMPWNGKGMHGRITFEFDSRIYILERLSSPIKTTESLYCLTTGEEIKDRIILSAPGEYFFGVEAQSFFATAFYSGEKSASSLSATEEIIAKLTNTVNDNSAEVSYRNILETINEEILNLTSSRRKNAAIPIAETALKTKQEQFNKCQIATAEAEKLTLENKAFQNKIEKLRVEIQELKKENHNLSISDVAVGNNNMLKYVFSALTICFLVLFVFIKNTIFAIASVVLAFCGIYFEVKSIAGKRNLKKAIYTKNFTIQRNSDKIVMLTEELASLETTVARNNERCIYLKTANNPDEIKYEIEQLQAKICGLKTEVEALELSKTALTNAYTSYKELFVPNLSRVLGDVLSKITEGKYTCAVVDDSLNMSVESNFGYKSTPSLSQGAKFQSALSLQIALSEMILSQKCVPLFLDDALAFYDDSRALAALGHLLELSQTKQVIFSTCRKRETDILINKDVNYINLNN